MTADAVHVGVASKGEEMPDGQTVDDRALVLSENECVTIEGDMLALRKLSQRISRRVDPYRHADLAQTVGRARKMAERGSSDDELESLKEALDVALTILGREDLR
jgi:hypothetical protein